MSDPRRLLDGEADELEVRLLSAGRYDGPSGASRRRIMAGLGFGGALTIATAASTAQAGSSGVLASLGRAALRHWALSAAVGGVAVWASVELSRNEPLPPRPPAALGNQQTAKPVEPAAPAAFTGWSPASQVERSMPETEPAPRPPANTATRRGLPAAAGKDASSLPEELSALESARRALVAGDAKRALQQLDEYARRFSKPRLGTEAAVLRIEALIANGERARANQLGRDFLAKHTNGPYERRVRSLMVGAKEPRERGP
jgi:hypothetical protein